MGRNKAETFSRPAVFRPVRHNRSSGSLKTLKLKGRLNAICLLLSAINEGLPHCHMLF